jgi:hypothetical protein
MLIALVKFVYILILCPFVAHAGFTMLGIDSAGNEIEAVISKADYKKLMTESLVESNKIVNQQANTQIGGFYLHRISIGIGGDANIGIGPFQIGGGIQQKFYFERLNE